MSGAVASELAIGVLALQGAFSEHVDALRTLGVRTCEVRTAEELAGLDGLIMPGGESTAMHLIAKPAGGGSCAAVAKKNVAILAGLHDWVRVRKMPTWGTCAGLILLADRLVGAAKGGGSGSDEMQGVLGGLDITVNRNFFGRQLASFEAMLPPPPAPARADAEASAATAVAADGEAKLFRGLFIRAPAIVEVGGAGGVTVLSKVRHTAGAAAASGAHFGEGEVGVAVQQGQLLGCSFHPELTEDMRWHEHFVRMVREHRAAAAEPEAEPEA